MLLSALVGASAAVAASSSRKAKIALLADVLRRREGPGGRIAVAWLTGTLPQGRIGLGPAAIRKAFPDGAAEASVLTVREVDEAFQRIAGASGKGSGGEKGRLLHELLTRATKEEQRFLARLVFGELRQGALEGVVAEAVAEAAGVPAAAVRRAVMAHGNLAEVASAALADGEAGLARFAIRLFTPVQPMLAQPADDAADAFARLGDEAAVEYKLDGARIQAHKDGDDVRIFTRHLREVTPALPEIVECVRAMPARQLILDGEAIALRADGTPHPFQVTMRRFGRKLDAEALRAELPLTPFFFDALLRDGAPLVDEPYERRTAALRELVPEARRVPSRLVTGAAAAAAFLAEAMARGHEGIMAKSRASAYEAGSRGVGWMKIKPAHTLDLVILAAEWGSGRRQGWLSNLHLGARDEANGGFVMLGKTFKGLTDAMLQWQTEQFLARELARDEHAVYVRPEIVAEIAFADVQTSPRYPAGMALRLARVKRYREDKTAAQADTIDAVRAIWRKSRGEAA